MTNENKQMLDKAKKQEREIIELKRAINILQRSIQKLQAGYQRNADQIRKNNGDIQSIVRNIKNS